MVVLPRVYLFRITQPWPRGESVIVEASTRREAIKKADLPGGKSEWLAWATVSKGGFVLNEYGHAIGELKK